MKKIKQLSVLLVILAIHQLLTVFIRNSLDPIHFTGQNFFILELTGQRGEISKELLFIFDAGNLLLLWLIGRRIFSLRFSLIPAVIYAISPWGSYSVAAGSFYIYLLFLILLGFYSLLLIYQNQNYWGPFLFIGSVILAGYSSFLLFLILPFLFISLIFFKLFSVNKFKRVLIYFGVLFIPLLFLIFKNPVAFKNIYENEVKIFSDPGLLNMVNTYQGAAAQEGLGKLAKVSENKYLFFSEYVFLRYIKQLIPPTYFTPQEKLLNFSFSPPIYLGFLIPFFLGLYQILQSSNLRKILLISTLLVIPSALAKSMVDLNRLVIFSPVVVFIVSYGFIKMVEKIKEKKASIALALVVSLVIFQLFVTISDIQLREKERFIKYYEQDYELGKQ